MNWYRTLIRKRGEGKGEKRGKRRAEEREREKRGEGKGEKRGEGNKTQRETRLKGREEEKVMAHVVRVCTCIIFRGPDSSSVSFGMASACTV